MFAADNARLVSYDGVALQHNGVTQVGSIAYDRPSNATFDFNFWQGTSFTQIARNVSVAYLLLTVAGVRFASSNSPVLHNIIWSIDPFTSNKNQNLSLFESNMAKPADMTLQNGTLDMSMNFNGTQRVFYTLKAKLPNINTTQSPYIFVTWRSTDHVVRLDVWEGDPIQNDYRIVVESADGRMYGGTHGGAYSSGFTTTAFKFPPNKILTLLDMGLDSGGGHGGSFPVSGTQHAFFSSIKFGNASIPTSFVSIAFNGKRVVGGDVGLPLGNNIYTWEATASNTADTIQQSINTSGISLHNYLTVTVGRNTQIEIDSAGIRMITHTENVTVPYLRHLPSLLVVGGATLGVLANVFFVTYLANKVLVIDESAIKKKEASVKE
jgi:hypothetical protein